MEWNNNLCRACLKENEYFTYYLFKNVSPETYSFCTSVEVHEDEKLPTALCNNCYELLTAYGEFKQTCIQSQDVLSQRRLKPEVNSELIQEYEKPYISRDVKEEDSSNEYHDDFTDVDYYIDIQVQDKSIGAIEREVKVPKGEKLDKHKQCKDKLSQNRKFIYTCDVCSKKFSNVHRFEAHKLEHDGKTMRYPCVECGKDFASSAGLQKHERATHIAVSLRHLSCPTCGRVSATAHALALHRRRHRPRANHMCHVCGKHVADAAALTRHLENHASTKSLHACNICGKTYRTVGNLASHRSRQHSTRRYICAHCNHTFANKYNLSKHILIHEGRKPFQCNICSKSVGSKSALVEHKRTHSGERPFACVVCEKRFLSKRILRDHHKVHSGLKPHKCGICEHSFAQRGTLQRHMKVHRKAKYDVSVEIPS